jgi:hypothetical protein
MTGQVMHRERLAWDAARVVVRALGSKQTTQWLHAEMRQQLGPGLAAALLESRDRLWSSPRPDAPLIESGIWRAKLTDLLADGSLAQPLQRLVAGASVRLGAAVDIREPVPVDQADEPRVIDLDRYR